MDIGYQRPPMLSLFPPRAPPGFASLIAHTMFGFAVRVRARVRGAGQNLMNSAVRRACPMDFAPLVDDRKLQSMLQKPQQNLARGSQLHKFREYQLHGILNSKI